jgi:hypothetical protein
MAHVKQEWYDSELESFLLYFSKYFYDKITPPEITI